MQPRQMRDTSRPVPPSFTYSIRIYYLPDGKRVKLVVGGHKNTPVDHDGGLEMLDRAHLLVRSTSREDELAGLSIERVQAICELGARRPDDGICAAVGSRDDGRAAAQVVGAPGDREPGRRRR